jgi:hypothetical protein
MTIASNQRIARLEQKLEQIEAGLQVLLRAPIPTADLDAHPTIVKLKYEIQGLKMRMGRVRETA